jgi:cyclic-di-GMP-binding protein
MPEPTAFSFPDLPPMLQPLLAWLSGSRREGLPEELEALLQLLETLRHADLAGEPHTQLLNLLAAQIQQLIEPQFEQLPDVSLPVPRRVRRLTRAMQEVLQALAQDYLDLADQASIGRAARLPLLVEAMRCLTQHLLISDLVAAPAGLGIWQKLHATYHQGQTPDGRGESDELRHLYAGALLLASAHPASFTSRELLFIAAYVDRQAAALQISTVPPEQRHDMFWIDPSRDLPAQAQSRRMAPSDTPLYYFTCEAVAEQAQKHLNALEQGIDAAQLGLSALADTPSGQGVLRRLGNLLGNPAKRRFTRRRQSYRAQLCPGLGSLWQLFSDPEELPEDISHWMITNESPDGYAMMHLAGKTSRLHVGDVVALRPEIEGEDEQWQICIVRWALSENPEHVELGLQILAPNAIPALLSIPSHTTQEAPISALLLPEIPHVRPQQTLIVPAGTLNLDNRRRKLVLLVEQENLSVREIQTARVDEQNARIEAFTIRPDDQV